MLINLSNHPFEKWSIPQLEAAEKYGTIIDLAFPIVDPMADSFQINNLAEDYFLQIVAIIMRNSEGYHAVHIMGELTFCFLLVQKLHSNGIMCVASTTERNVVEENNFKTTEFQFCRFRQYL